MSSCAPVCQAQRHRGSALRDHHATRSGIADGNGPPPFRSGSTALTRLHGARQSPGSVDILLTQAAAHRSLCLSLCVVWCGESPYPAGTLGFRASERLKISVCGNDHHLLARSCAAIRRSGLGQPPDQARRSTQCSPESRGSGGARGLRRALRNRWASVFTPQGELSYSPRSRHKPQVDRRERNRRDPLSARPKL
jgi:hypothetical protein